MNEKKDPHAERLSRPSFREAFRRAAEQVELDCFDPRDRDACRELCYIIAEVYLFDDDAKILITGEILPAYVVRQVFELLTHEHLLLVRENFRAQGSHITNKRSYLRTALYNSVFEFEANYENLLSEELKKRKGD